MFLYVTIYKSSNKDIFGLQEEIRAKLPKYQRQTPVKTVDTSTSTPQPPVEVSIALSWYLNHSILLLFLPFFFLYDTYLKKVI